MKYMGSKARLAKDISPIINGLIATHGITEYVEPFCGGANMIQHVKCARKFGYDNNFYLISFLNAIKGGWNPLDEVDMSKELYERIKKEPNKYPPHYVALAGFCASYNAKWFGGYAGTVKTKHGTIRNYYDESVRNVLRQAEHLRNTRFFAHDYKTLSIEGALIYCDPPYEGTTTYNGSFDHQEYWQWVRKMCKKNIVLCSEYKAPDDFKCIWQKQLTTTLDKNSRSEAVEKLFVYKGEKK